MCGPYCRLALLAKPPQAWLNRELIAEYVARLRKTNQDLSIVSSLPHLRPALRLICPKEDWTWLLTITKRIAAAAPRSDAQRELSKATAMQYRDGLLIALLAAIAVRRRTVSALRNGVQLIKSGDLWVLEIPPEDV